MPINRNKIKENVMTKMVKVVNGLQDDVKVLRENYRQNNQGEKYVVKGKI